MSVKKKRRTKYFSVHQYETERGKPSGSRVKQYFRRSITWMGKASIPHSFPPPLPSARGKPPLVSPRDLLDETSGIEMGNRRARGEAINRFFLAMGNHSCLIGGWREIAGVVIRETDPGRGAGFTRGRKRRMHFFLLLRQILLASSVNLSPAFPSGAGRRGVCPLPRRRKRGIPDTQCRPNEWEKEASRGAHCTFSPSRK